MVSTMSMHYIDILALPSQHIYFKINNNEVLGCLIFASPYIPLLHHRREVHEVESYKLSGKIKSKKPDKDQYNQSNDLDCCELRRQVLWCTQALTRPRSWSAPEPCWQSMALDQWRTESSTRTTPYGNVDRMVQVHWWSRAWITKQWTVTLQNKARGVMVPR